MKKIYRTPKVRVLEINPFSILAGSQLENGETENVNTDPTEVLDGDNIEIL